MSAKAMPNKLSATIYLVIFLGGAIGVSLRYLIEYSFESLLDNSQNPQLLATSTVNLAGAFLLGFVNSHHWFQELNKKLFFGHGLLGGFTTMSGLAAVAVAAGIEVSLEALGFWLFVFAQLIAGVLSYALGIQIARRVKK